MKLQKYKRTSDYSYALGATLVAELLNAHPELIVRVFLRPADKYGDNLEDIIAKLKTKHIEIIESTKAFNILGAKENCLLAAEFKKPAQSLDASARHIILVNPSDSGNLGTIIRTAVAFDFNNIAIITPAVDCYDPKTIRATMGAIFHINIKTYSDIADYLSENPRTELFAFMLDPNAKTLKSTKASTNNYSLVFGNEASGLPKDFCHTANATPVFIPQSKNVDSLNLSIAAGIAMHYFSPSEDSAA